MENRKNTILLTVIAVATLLVAVVGATFAYFTAQGNGGASKAVTVTTHTTDSATFEIAGALAVTADQDSFAQGKGDAIETTTATATFKAGNAEAADMCYNVTLEITSNDFIKCASDTTPDGTRTLCATNDAVTDKNAKELAFTAKKGDEILVDAADITVGTTAVQVPNAAGGANYEHKIHAAAGATVVDNWTFEARLINLEQDQGYNTGKKFVGAIKFTQVECAA